jgi:hypothetical protein
MSEAERAPGVIVSPTSCVTRDSRRVRLFMQPVAPVDRTKEQLSQDLSLDGTWRRVCDGVGMDLDRGALHYGHPACNITVPVRCRRFRQGLGPACDASGHSGIRLPREPERRRHSHQCLAHRVGDAAATSYAGRSGCLQPVSLVANATSSAQRGHRCTVSTSYLHPSTSAGGTSLYGKHRARHELGPPASGDVCLQAISGRSATQYVRGQCHWNTRAVDGRSFALKARRGSVPCRLGRARAMFDSPSQAAIWRPQPSNTHRAKESIHHA